MSRSTDLRTALLLLALAGPLDAQPAPQPLSILDVPFIAQSEALCGGAAAAMVLRYWGERSLTAETFAHLVDRSAAGIRTDALVGELRQRGWKAQGVAAGEDTLAQELAAGRPVIALIEDRPGTFHYVVIVAATPGVIVFHDPARAPYRVMSSRDFGRRWQAAGRWMAVIVPDAARARNAPDTTGASPLPASATPCDQLVADGVGEAQAGNLDAAERSLTAAVGCPGAAALRELAGVRVLQRRWQDAGDLASAAVAIAPDDAYAWRVLGTSRFLLNDPDGALEAWNQVGEPRVDLLRVEGLSRTRQRVVERLVGIDTGAVLAPPLLARAGRRLAELPAAVNARLSYVPVAGGLAELRASVFERPTVPSSRLDLLSLGLTAAARRELAVPIASVSGGGERIALRWRFWRGRPLYGASVTAPAPWGGIWGVDASYSEQPLDRELSPARRTTATMSVGDWALSRLRWTIRGGVDRWEGSAASGLGQTGRSAFGRAGAGIRIVPIDGLLELGGDGDIWAGPDAFATASIEALGRSSAERRGVVFTGRGGLALATTSTPADLWFFGDAGHGSTIRLRAHRAFEDGRLRVAGLGRAAVYGSFEAQHWWQAPWSIAAGAAAFADTARIGRRLPSALAADGRTPGEPRQDTDVGFGLRLAIPGLAGVLRVDAARGLRDRAHALSLAYEPW